MKFDIYHSKQSNFFAESLPKESYQTVATIEASSLDEAYLKSQNIDSCWVNDPDVDSTLENCRSTSVGDIIINNDENQAYMVMDIGFEKVENFY